MDKNNIIERINNRKDYTVGIIGLGYVGLPLMLAFSEKGYPTLGFDVDKRKLISLNKGESYIKHISLPPNRIFPVTDDFTKLAECDAVIICVPTPLNRNREPDMSYVETSARYAAKTLHEGQLVILESTTYPGTTDTLVKDILEKGTSLKAGKNFHLAFSPEREDPGNAKYNTVTIPKIVGGFTPDCTEIAVTLYKNVLDKVIAVADCRVAEMTKLLENIFRSVNIALVNELKMLCDVMDINIWDVIDAAATKPFGYMPFYPGPGLGGHCIPIDPFYLTWKAREYEQPTRFIELAGEINTGMHHYVIDKLAFVLNEFKKPINGTNILIIGVAYKKNVDDLRESPALAIIDKLKKLGANIKYYDPYIPELNGDVSIEYNESELKKFNAALIVTDHSNVDYQLLLNSVPVVVDTRNATKNVKRNRNRIYRA